MEEAATEEVVMEEVETQARYFANTNQEEI